MPRRTDTRIRLIEAVVRALDAGSEDAIRLREIAREVGIAEPSIYTFFPHREALIVEAQAARYQRGLVEYGRAFVDRMAQCRDVAAFREIVIDVLGLSLAEDRAAVRSLRANVLGSAQVRPELARRVDLALTEAQTLLAGGLAEAQGRGWIGPQCDVTTAARWIIAVISARSLLELHPDRPGAEAWDRMTIESILVALGLAPIGAEPLTR